MPLKKRGKWGYGLLPEGLTLCAVGWLSNSVPTQGEVPADCISRLWQAFKKKRYCFDGTAGWHDCELCQGQDDWYPNGQVGPIVQWRGRKMRVRGYGHFLIQSSELIYIAPVLILHYILDHSYRPPDAFVETVMQGEFLKPSDLVWVEGIDV
jgi:hypothetical protein